MKLYNEMRSILLFESGMFQASLQRGFRLLVREGGDCVKKEPDRC